MLALRFYTTPAFKSLNAPLRTGERHPFPCTLTFVSDAIKRLRAADEPQEPSPRDGGSLEAIGSINQGARLLNQSTAQAAGSAAGRSLAALQALTARIFSRGSDGAAERLPSLPPPLEPLVCWRGMRDLVVTSTFMAEGGSELAPMSTTTDLRVALEFTRMEQGSRSGAALLFRVLADNMMQRGAGTCLRLERSLLPWPLQCSSTSACVCPSAT